MNATPNIQGRPDYFQRHGVTKLDAMNLCRILGLNPNRNIVWAAHTLVTMKMKW
jgi:hypothetical protein